MVTNNQKNNDNKVKTLGKAKTLGLIMLLLLAIIITYNTNFSYSWSHGLNYRNVTVDTRVNITNSYPEILQIIINGGNDITLTAGSTTNVSVKVVARDYNGGSTITNVTAVFFDNSTKTFIGPADNNDFYSRVQCNPISGEVNGYNANFTCDFEVYYYANPSTQWMANITINDDAFTPSVNVSAQNVSTILSLYALNVTPLIDYGDMAVTDTSPPIEANITNYGNENINISVKGYAQTEGDGLAFVCQVGNITIDNEKFSLNQTGDYAIDYDSLSNNFQPVTGLTLNQQINDAQQVINSTYWRLYIPPNPFGLCNGSIVFQAEQS